jgi:hypothetical protein
MERDNDEAVRERYNLQIAATEQKMADLHAEEQEAVQTLELFAEAMMQDFSRIEAIEAELNRRANQQDRFSELAAQRQYLSRSCTWQQDALQETYAEARVNLEIEREALQRERDELTAA